MQPRILQPTAVHCSTIINRLAHTILLYCLLVHRLIIQYISGRSQPVCAHLTYDYNQGDLCVKYTIGYNVFTIICERDAWIIR